MPLFRGTPLRRFSLGAVLRGRPWGASLRGRIPLFDGLLLWLSPAVIDRDGNIKNLSPTVTDATGTTIFL